MGLRNSFSPIESVDDEDEVLLALAEELGNFVEYVGGPGEITQAS
jgi:hypothetical protein